MVTNFNIIIKSNDGIFLCKYFLVFYSMSLKLTNMVSYLMKK